jgi:hypothetical protein
MGNNNSTASKLFRGCLGLDVVDQATGATKRRVGFFGLFDPKRKSLQDSLLEGSMFCLSMFMFICLIVLIIYAAVAMQFFQKLLTGPEMEENWWEVSKCNVLTLES